MDEKRITGAAKEVGGKVQGAVGELVGDRETQARGRANEVEGGVENLYGQAKDTVRDVADQAADVARSALRQNRASYPEVERAFQDGTDAVVGYAKESPLMLAAAAALAGYLLALVIHGRR